MTNNYTDANDGRFPSATFAYGSEWYAWPQQLAMAAGRYSSLAQAKLNVPGDGQGRGSSPETFAKNYANYQEFYCPSQENIWSAVLSSAYERCNSYTVNTSVFGRTNSPNYYPSMKDTLISAPSENGLIWDTIRIEPGCANKGAAFYRDEIQLDNNPAAGFIHNDICNILFVDGHVGNALKAATGYLPIAYESRKHPIWTANNIEREYLVK